MQTNECRLCFGVATPDEIAEGVRRLGRAVKSVRLSSKVGAEPKKFLTGLTG